MICGNGPSLKYLIKNKNEFEDYDLLLFNFGPVHCELDIKYHLFEVDININDKIGSGALKDGEFKRYLKGDTARTQYLIDKSNNFKNFLKLKKLDKRVIHLKKRRIVHYPELKFIENIKKSIKKDFIPYAKSSVVYSVFLAIKLNYTHIEFLGINPQNNGSFYFDKISKKVHNTIKPDKGYNSYDLIKIISKVDIFREIKFKVNENNGWDFLN